MKTNFKWIFQWVGWAWCFSFFLILMAAQLWLELDLGPRLAASWFQKAFWFRAIVFIAALYVSFYFIEVYRSWRRAAVCLSGIASCGAGISILFIVISYAGSSFLGVFGEIQALDQNPTRQVWLQGLKLSVQREDWVNPRSVEFDRSLDFLNASELSTLTDRLGSGLRINRYIGLAQVSETVQAPRPEGLPPGNQTPTKVESSGIRLLRVLDEKTGKILAEWSDQQIGQSVQAAETKVTLKKFLYHAGVGASGLSDGAKDSPLNIAAELLITKQSQTFREVVFEKYPTFTLVPGQDLGVKFIFGSSSDSGTAESGASRFSSIDPAVIENPKREVKEVKNYRGSALPPSALLLSQVGGDQDQLLWILEGETLQADWGGHQYRLDYRPKSFDLPFDFDPKNASLGEIFNKGGFKIQSIAKGERENGHTYQVFSVIYDPFRVLSFLGAAMGVLVFAILLLQKEARWRHE